MKISLFNIISVLSLSIFFSFNLSYSSTQSPLYDQSCNSNDWPHELSDLQPDPDIFFGRLENGFRYILLKNQYPKDRTTILLNVNAGSLNEEFEESGLAHFLEHMLFNGSTHFKPGELIDYFQDIGMSFGGDTNAYTTYEDTVYKIILPASDQDMLRDGLLVMGDYARGALLQQTEIDRERGVILAEKNERETASFRSYKASTLFSFEGTLLPERFAIGRKDVLEGADRQQIKTFYDKWYRPDNMVLVMVGDFNAEVAETLIHERFDNMQGSGEKFTCPDYGLLTHAGVESFFHPEPDLGYTSVSIQTLRNKSPENDSFDYQVKNLYRYMAARIINFRLEQELEEAQTSMSSARFSFNSTLDRYQHSAIIAKTGGENWQEALESLNRILKQAIQYGFTDEETEMVKNELVSHLQRAVQTRETRNSLDLARNIINTINRNRVIQSPVQEENLYSSPIMKATAADLHSAFREEWRDEMRLIEVLGDAKIVGSDPREVIKQYYQDLQGQEVTAKLSQEVAAFPYLPEMSTVGPVKSEALPIPETTRYMYKNGVVLNLKKTSFKKNSISMAIHFGDGEKSVPTGGLSLLAEAVVNGSGTATLKDSELSMILAGSSVRYRFRVGDESFSLIGRALNSDIDILFQVLQSIMLDPGMRPDVYQSAMKRFDLMYKGMNGNINGGAMLYLEPFFAGNTITHGLPPKKEFETLGLDDVNQWLLPQFKNSALEITIVGDLDDSEIVSLVSKYFGSLPGKDYSENISNVLPRFPVRQSFETSMHLNEDKGLVQMAWLTDDYWDIKRTRRLHILAAVIDERLRKLIREESGDSYSPAAYSSNSRIYPGYGRIVIEVMTDGRSLDSVVEQIHQVIQSLHDDPVTNDELERSKQPVITSIKDRIKTNDYWLSSVLSLSTRHPDQLEWPQTLIDDFSSITVEDLSSLIKKYMTEERLATGIIRADHGGDLSPILEAEK
jgi:zinc protease